MFKKITTPGSSEFVQNSELLCISSYKGLTISYYNHEEDTFWLIRCRCIVTYKIIDKEFSQQKCLTNLPTEGTFIEVLDSSWIKEYRDETILSKSKHCIFRFRDQTIEVIAQEFIYEQLKQRPIIEYEWEMKTDQL